MQQTNDVKSLQLKESLSFAQSNHIARDRSREVVFAHVEFSQLRKNLRLMTSIQSDDDSAALSEKTKLRAVMLITTTTHECGKFAASAVNEAIELDTASKSAQRDCVSWLQTVIMNSLHDMTTNEEAENADLTSVHDAAFKAVSSLDDSHNNQLSKLNDVVIHELLSYREIENFRDCIFFVRIDSSVENCVHWLQAQLHARFVTQSLFVAEILAVVVVSADSLHDNSQDRKFILVLRLAVIMFRSLFEKSWINVLHERKKIDSRLLKCSARLRLADNEIDLRQLHRRFCLLSLKHINTARSEEVFNDWLDAALNSRFIVKINDEHLTQTLKERKLQKSSHLHAILDQKIALKFFLSAHDSLNTQ